MIFMDLLPDNTLPRRDLKVILRKEDSDSLEDRAADMALASSVCREQVLDVPVAEDFQVRAAAVSRE